MHETLCYVWFSGAWNQGTWMGLGNTVFSQLYPAEAEQHTPWQYPYLSRRQHAEKVYSDYCECSNNRCLGSTTLTTDHCEQSTSK